MMKIFSFKKLSIVFCFLFSCISYADWGSQGVSEDKRTNQNWENIFPSVPNITVDENSSEFPSIKAAINYCNYTIPDDPCFIKVNPGTYQENESNTEIYINRSNIKISGTRTGASLEFSDWVTVIESDQPSFISLQEELKTLL